MTLFAKHSLILLFLFAGQFLIAQTPNFVEGELLIQLAPETEQSILIRKIETDLNIEVEEFVCISDVMHIYKIGFTDKKSDLDKILKSFLFYSEITSAQKNHLVYERETIPTDTLFDNQWQHKNSGLSGGIADADIDTPDAWDITTGGLTTHGDTIVVCIIEGSGVDINHVDLKNNIWKNYAEIPNDGIDNDNNGYIDDFNGWHVINLDDVIGAGSHGTRVAGMIGASGNNITGVSGVNWNVKMMIVQGQQTSNESTVLAAYNYPLKMRKRYNESLGQEGAFVVATNSSWGIDGADAADSPLWCAMYDSLGYYGVLNIAATTNDNANVDLVGDMPTTCASEFLVGVTMTNNQDLRANSGYGTTNVDLGAPGQNIYTTSLGNLYTTSSGTSFASPCVAGCVALAYSAPCAEFINFVKYDPAAAALDMRHYLLESVDQNPGLMSEVASGGRANVKKYIDSLLAACNPATCISPYNVIVSAITDTSATIEWNGFSTDYVFYLQEGNAVPIQSDATGLFTLSFDTLKPCTYYTVYVQANCGSDSSVLSFPVTFQTDGCCNNPGLVVSSATENSITIAWNDILYATSYDIQYKLNSDANWTEYTSVVSPFTFTGLVSCSDYDFQIHTQCADSTHGYSTTQTFKTLGCGACTEKNYCAVSGSNSNTEWIESLALNGFSNNTGNNSGWYQSNQIITALTPGVSYTVSFTPGYSGFNFTEGFSVWIDFNQDGIFDVTENMISNLTSNTTTTGIMNIPSGALIGVTKMRVGMNATAAPEICPTATFYGEYEDYCVYIGPQTGLTELENQITIHPNPATDMIFIHSELPINGILILDSSGRLVETTALGVSNSLSLEGLSAGMYFIQIQTENGISVHRIVKK